MLPPLGRLVQQATQRARPIPTVEIGVVVAVRDGAQEYDVECPGGVFSAIQAGDAPLKAGDRVTLSRNPPELGGGVLIHGPA